MKKTNIVTLIGIISFGFNLNVNAQNFTPENGKIMKSGSLYWASFDVDPGDAKITSSSLLLDEKAIDKLAKFLKKEEKKAIKWAQIAQREGVKDFCKSLEMNKTIKVFSFVYNKDNKIYGNETHKDLFIDAAFFQVDNKGECYIWIPCDAGTQEVPIDNNVLSTTSVNTNGSLDLHTAVGHSSTREKEIHHIGLLKINIRVNDVGAFVNHLNQLVAEMKSTGRSNKTTDKLFK